MAGSYQKPNKRSGNSYQHLKNYYSNIILKNMFFNYYNTKNIYYRHIYFAFNFFFLVFTDKKFLFWFYSS